MSRCISLDIEKQIMKKLPVKSLIRFTSACKSWKSLIECSEFVAAYKVLPTQPHQLLLRYKAGDREEHEVRSACFVDDDNFPNQKLDPIFPSLVQSLDRYTIIDSSQGLLCFHGFFTEPDSSTTEMAVLWNPSIRKSIAVVVPDPAPQPVKSVLGFGVCPDTKDAKLVMITYIVDFEEMESITCIPNQVMVFTLSSKEWKTLSSNLPRKSIGGFRFQVVIGQFIYWLAYDSVNENEFYNLVISFDLSTDEFIEIHLPETLCALVCSISRLRESLVLFTYNVKFTATASKQVCDIWMMEHGDSITFTKLFTINPPNASVSWAVGFRNSDEPVIEVQDDLDAFDSPYALVVYDPCSEDIKDLGICVNRYSSSVYSYMESLLLIDQDDGHIVRFGAVES